jgi:NADH-quinone oxidoreductase subunit G
VTSLPDQPGRDGDAIIAAAAAGELRALVIGGVELADLSDPSLAAKAVQTAEFVVNLEVRASEVSPHAHVVFPVAPVTEKAGSFVDWEGRVRTFDNIFRDPGSLPDLRVLSGVAEEMGVDLGFRTVEQARARMTEFGAWDGERAAVPTVVPGSATPAREGEAVLATWKLLIDDGRMLDGDEYLKATGRRPVALVSANTLSALGVEIGARVALGTDRGSVELPVAVADLPDGVVWAPASSRGVSLLRDLGATPGSVVRLEGGAA